MCFEVDSLLLVEGDRWRALAVAAFGQFKLRFRVSTGRKQVVAQFYEMLAWHICLSSFYPALLDTHVE